MTIRTRVIGASIVALTCAVSLRAQTPAPELPAIDVIRAAVVDRLGPNVEITITPVSVPADPKVFRAATPDPSAFLGKPIRFSLSTASGRVVSVVVEVKAVAE